ncbi:GNAT family N-acetyltransferase [Sessilibacter sp. MAH4]
MNSFLSKNDISVEITNWEKSESELCAIRREVFIEEQGVSEQDELDGKDHLYTQVIVRSKNHIEAIGCARISPEGKIGRVAIVKNFRGLGVGQKLMEFCTQAVLEKGQTPKLDAQTSAIGFYESLGYACEGEVFMDANIPHKHMKFALASFFVTQANTNESSETNYSPEPQPLRRALKSTQDSEAALLNCLEQSRAELMITCSTALLRLVSSHQFLEALKTKLLTNTDSEVKIVIGSYDSGATLIRSLIDLSRRLPSKLKLKCLNTDQNDFSALIITNAQNSVEIHLDGEQLTGIQTRLSNAKKELLREEFYRIWDARSFAHPDFKELNL